MSSTQLSHYGVKGMKWGVHRNGDVSTESRSERKESSRNLNAYMWNAVANEPMWQRMTKADYDSLSTKGETFAKNTTLRRVTMDKEATLKGATYVSKLKADSDFYRASIPAVGPQTKGKGGGQKRYKEPHYEIEMETVKKLNLPSEKARFEAFMDILGTPSIKMSEKKAPISGRQFLEQNGYKKLFGEQTNQELAFKAWHDFVASQGDQDSPINKAYFDKLKSKGYNALVDGNDQGTYAKNPLIILDPEGTVKIRDVRQLSTDEINQAQRRLVPRKAD